MLTDLPTAPAAIELPSWAAQLLRPAGDASEVLAELTCYPGGGRTVTLGNRAWRLHFDLADDGQVAQAELVYDGHPLPLGRNWRYELGFLAAMLADERIAELVEPLAAQARRRPKAA